MMVMCINIKEGQWERKRREGEEPKRAGGGRSLGRTSLTMYCPSVLRISLDRCNDWVRGEFSRYEYTLGLTGPRAHAGGYTQ